MKILIIIITIVILSLVLVGCSSAVVPIPQIPSTTISVDTSNVETASSVKPLPGGWVLYGEPIAEWGTSLPAVTGVIPDSIIKIEYWETNYTTENGFRLPIKRATLSYEYITRITIERVDLHFVNVDYVLSITNHESSHYILDGVEKTIQIKQTGFPQLKAEDVIKYKVLLVYGTPQEFDGTWYKYSDYHTEMMSREVDELHLKVNIRSLNVEQQLRDAIEEIYSDEGIELKKQQLIEGFDL